MELVIDDSSDKDLSYLDQINSTSINQPQCLSTQKSPAFTCPTAEVQFYSVPNTLRFGLRLKTNNGMHRGHQNSEQAGAQKNILKTKNQSISTRLKRNMNANRHDHKSLQLLLRKIIRNEMAGFECQRVKHWGVVVRDIPRSFFIQYSVHKHNEQKQFPIFECRYNECPKLFRVACNFRNHMFSHLRMRPHSCPKCGKSFTQQSNLKTHLKNIH